jgi:hypothetical protein
MVVDELVLISKFRPDEQRHYEWLADTLTEINNDNPRLPPWNFLSYSDVSRCFD